jgi:hypothetical protein
MTTYAEEARGDTTGSGPGLKLLFLDVIGSIAWDLTLPDDHLFRQAAEEWLANSGALAEWVGMLGADSRISQMIGSGLASNPVAMHRSCVNLSKSGRDDGFRAFSIAMGLPDPGTKENLSRQEIAADRVIFNQ